MWGSAIFLSSSGRKHLAPDATGGPRESITRPAEYGRRYNGTMKFLFDLFPVALFFVAFKLFDIYTATAVAIGAILLQIGWLKWKRRKVDTMMWISLALIRVFAGARLGRDCQALIN